MYKCRLDPSSTYFQTPAYGLIVYLLRAASYHEIEQDIYAVQIIHSSLGVRKSTESALATGFWKSLVREDVEGKCILDNPREEELSLLYRTGREAVINNVEALAKL